MYLSYSLQPKKYKYFNYKKTHGAQIKLHTTAFNRKLGRDNMSKQCTTYRKYEHTQFHSGMGTQTQTDCAHIFLSLIPSSFTAVPSNLASHAHVKLTSHIVFLRFQA